MKDNLAKGFVITDLTNKTSENLFYSSHSKYLLHNLRKVHLLYCVPKFLFQFKREDKPRKARKAQNRGCKGTVLPCFPCFPWLRYLNSSPYLEKLVENLFQTYRLGNADIGLKIDLEENIFFDMDTAIPLGIIVNEFVSNSLKHAFSDRRTGEIRIKLYRTNFDESEIGRDEKDSGDKITGFI